MNIFVTSLYQILFAILYVVVTCGLSEPLSRTEARAAHGMVSAGNDQLLVDATGKSEISVQDYAIAMIDEQERPAHVPLALYGRLLKPRNYEKCLAKRKKDLHNSNLFGAISLPSEPFIGPPSTGARQAAEQ